MQEPELFWAAVLDRILGKFLLGVSITTLLDTDSLKSMLVWSMCMAVVLLCPFLICIFFPLPAVTWLSPTYDIGRESVLIDWCIPDWCILITRYYDLNCFLEITTQIVHEILRLNFISEIWQLKLYPRYDELSCILDMTNKIVS